MNTIFSTSRRITRALALFTYFAGLTATDSLLAQVWSQTSAPDKNWSAVATSADGTKLAAACQSGGIYTSTNAGATWTLTSAPAKAWTALASSADGRILLAVAAYYYPNPGGIYTSTNFGSTWTSNAISGSYSWDAAAASASGNTLIVCANNLGPVYYSTNMGANWSSNGLPTMGYWNSVACTADGTKLAAEWGGTAYVSTNSGATWNNYQNTYAQVDVLFCSADGQQLLLQANNLYLSTNWGMTWTPNSIPNSSLPCAISADGKKVIQPANGIINVTTNLGATWSSSYAPAKTWKAIALSSNGSRLVAVPSGTDGVYVWQPPVLDCSNVAGNLLFSWPTNGTHFNLQATPDLTPASWATVTNLPIVTNSQNQIILSPSDNAGYFRLMSQ